MDGVFEGGGGGYADGVFEGGWNVDGVFEGWWYVDVVFEGGWNVDGVFEGVGGGNADGLMCCWLSHRMGIASWPSCLPEP